MLNCRVCRRRKPGFYWVSLDAGSSGLDGIRSNKLLPRWSLAPTANGKTPAVLTPNRHRYPRRLFPDLVFVLADVMGQLPGQVLKIWILKGQSRRARRSSSELVQDPEGYSSAAVASNETIRRRFERSASS